MNDQNNNGNILPEHIRESLAKYTTHENITCLQCGYSGLMGVKGEKDMVSGSSWAIKFFSLLAVFGIVLYIAREQFGFSFPWWLGFAAAVVFHFLIKNTKKIYDCPNCQSELLK